MSNISISEWLGKICIKRTTLFTDALLNSLIYQGIANWPQKYCNFFYIKIGGELLIDTIVPWTL